MIHRYVTLLLIAGVMTLALGLRDADAAMRCKAVGATCLKDGNCCSGKCAAATSGRHHMSGVCVAAGNPNGEACSADSQCTSSHCVDGVCCNTACTGSCFTCDGGTCAAKAAGEACDDGLFCTATDTCNGSGSCQGSGSTCPLESQSEQCTVCNEASDSCSQFEGLTCGLAIGQACELSFQCASNFCVDGVCCQSDCSNYCEACSAAKTGGSDGTCAPVTALTDPDSECDEGPCVTGLCNGAGACGAIEAGTDPKDQCPEGPCATGSCDGAGGCGALGSGTQCNDGVGCTQTDHCDGAGSCVSSNNGCGRTLDGFLCDCNEASDTCSFEGMSCFP
jgi:hypothetical protein